MPFSKASSFASSVHLLPFLCIGDPRHSTPGCLRGLWRDLAASGACSSFTGAGFPKRRSLSDAGLGSPPLPGRLSADRAAAGNTMVGARANNAMKLTRSAWANGGRGPCSLSQCWTDGSASSRAKSLGAGLAGDQGMLDATGVATLVEEALQQIEDRALVAQVRSLLVTPKPELRDWDYAPEGARYTVWIVVANRPSNLGIGYCESGFGPSCPWGLVFLAGPNTSMGADFGWFQHLEDAARDLLDVQRDA
jgi:hypothetical protein